MAEVDREKSLDHKDVTEQHQVPVGVEDAAAIPKGSIDPVYEAKARVLNHAVSFQLTRCITLRCITLR